MVSDDSQQHGKPKAEAGKDAKMLTDEQVDELLFQHAEAFMKRFEKLDEPEELRNRINRVIDRLEREGIDESLLEDEDEPKETARKTLSLEDVKRLLRQDAEAHGKLVDKTPEEVLEWFDRIVEEVEQGKPPEDEEWLLEEDKRLTREDERLAKEENEAKMLSLKDVEKMVRHELEVYAKQFERLNEPVEQQRRFDRIIERLEREGLDEPDDET